MTLRKLAAKRRDPANPDPAVPFLVVDVPAGAVLSCELVRLFMSLTIADQHRVIEYVKSLRGEAEVP